MVLRTARGLANALRQGDGTVTLNLQPPRLGQLKVHLTLQDAAVTARLVPTTDTARQLLIDSEHSLRAALEARGLSVERIDVEAVRPPPHAIDPAPQSDSGHAQDEHVHPDHPGGDSAGAWNNGDSAGSGAEAHTGDARDGHAEAAGPLDADAAGSLIGNASLSYELDSGGVYRLHLDALA